MDLFTLNLDKRNLLNSRSTTRVGGVKAQEDKNDDRGPVISDDNYNAKVLIGNWFERQAVYTPEPDDWKSLYKTDYKIHKSDDWRQNQNVAWDNKLEFEGLPWEVVIGTGGKEYYKNLTTSNDLKYNILLKNQDGLRRLRKYNARKLTWLPEEDLTLSYGNLTQFGLIEALRAKWEENSLEGLARTRWQTSYRNTIGTPVCGDVQSTGKFRRRKVDMNIPNLEHFKNAKLSNTRSCNLPFLEPSVWIH